MTWATGCRRIHIGPARCCCRRWWHCSIDHALVLLIVVVIIFVRHIVDVTST
jgi:hypothetical protein